MHLRIDNADRRLTPHGRRVGLISDDAWNDFLAKQERLDQMRKLLERTKLTPEMLNRISLNPISACHSEERSDEEPAVCSSCPCSMGTSSTLRCHGIRLPHGT